MKTLFEVTLLGIAFIAALFIRGCGPQSQPPQVTPLPETKAVITNTPAPTTQPATPTPAPATTTASLGGIVWHDLCTIAGGEGGEPLQPSDDCIPGEEGGFHANGLREPGEPGLENVLVSLGYGACGQADDHYEIRTDADGKYLFSGLSAGAYCLTIDSLHPENIFLLPGMWSGPAPYAEAVFAYDITLSVGEEYSAMDIGWDYQFLPAPSRP